LLPDGKTNDSTRTHVAAAAILLQAMVAMLVCSSRSIDLFSPPIFNQLKWECYI